MIEPLDLDQPSIDPTAFIAPDAQLHGAVRVAGGVVVMFGAVLRAEFEHISVGEDSNIQDHCVLHTDEGHPCVLGSRVTVGHQAVVHGARVGDRALIGVGARALNGAAVGEGAWLAAGSLLAEGQAIPAWTLAVGVPARPLRDLTEDEIRRADEGVDHYLRFGATYRRVLG